MRKSLLGTMRVPFLILAPACVLVGIGTAYWQTKRLEWPQVLLVMIGALCAHICVNVFNEYFDFRSGLDTRTQRTPFSGGSGALPAQPAMAKAALLLGWTTLAVVATIGLYFVWLRGWELLPVGILGLILLVTYTTRLAYYPLPCLIAPGLGFGILMVMGTHFALTGTYTWSALVASLVPAFLVSNLLLLNQFPDVEADKTVGRRHFPIVIGRQKSSLIFGAFLLSAYLSVIVGVALKLLPPWTLISLLTVGLAWRLYRGANRDAENIPALVPSMGLNVIINLAMPVLVALGLFIA